MFLLDPERVKLNILKLEEGDSILPHRVKIVESLPKFLT